MPVFQNTIQQLISSLNAITSIPQQTNSNKTIYLKDSRVAANLLNIGSDPSQLKEPKQKFLYFVNFVTPFAETTKRFNDFNNGISFLVYEIRKPTVEILTKKLNQYNKHRVVQLGLKYGDIDMKLIDTADNRALVLIKDYLQFYYGDHSAKNSSAWNNDVVANLYQYIEGSSPLNALDWGLRLPIVNAGSTGFYDANNSYYFSEINLFEFSGGYYTKFTFVHPKLARINLGNSSYNSSEINTIEINFEFEGLIILQNSLNTVKPQTKLSQAEAEQFGFNYSQFNDVKFPTPKIQQTSNSFNVQQASLFPKLNAPPPTTKQNPSSPPSVSRSSLLSNIIPGWINNNMSGARINRTSSIGFNLSPGFNPNANNRVFDFFL